MLIVGAGIAGLALARALRQRGITAEVVERVTEWEPSGAGLYLPANAVRASHELGIEPAAAAARIRSGVSASSTTAAILSPTGTLLGRDLRLVGADLGRYPRIPVGFRHS